MLSAWIQHPPERSFFPPAAPIEPLTPILCQGIGHCRKNIIARLFTGVVEEVVDHLTWFAWRFVLYVPFPSRAALYFLPFVYQFILLVSPVQLQFLCSRSGVNLFALVP